jgi:membrane peptidoglycan carboxypeptidase
VTKFSRDWFPRADRRARPGDARRADLLAQHPGHPGARSWRRPGRQPVHRLGITFPRGDRQLFQAGLAGAIATVEVNQVELTSGYAALANHGVQVPVRTILSITDANGNSVPTTADAPPSQVVTDQAAWLMSDILKDSTDPALNTVFGPRLQIVNGVPTARAGQRPCRPAAAKTGTANDLRDLLAFGYLAPPADPAAPQIVASVWTGNSDHSAPLAGDFSIIAADGPGRIWAAFLRELSRDWPIASFPAPPSGIVSATIDAWSGGAPGPWTRDTRQEWFIEGTQPGGANQVDLPGVLYRQMCNRWFVDITKVEPLAPPRWLEADLGWMAHARRHRPARRGRQHTRTLRAARSAASSPLGAKRPSRRAADAAAHPGPGRRRQGRHHPGPDTAGADTPADCAAPAAPPAPS